MYSGGEPKVIWYWTNDTGSFQRYTDDECFRIENAYKDYLVTGRDGGFSLTEKTPPILIYFGLMLQHDFSTEIQSNIKREGPQVSNAELNALYHKLVNTP